MLCFRLSVGICQQVLFVGVELCLEAHFLAIFANDFLLGEVANLVVGVQGFLAVLVNLKQLLPVLV